MFDEDGAVQALTAQAQLGVDKPVEKPSTFAGSWAAAAKAIPAAAAETARAFNQLAMPSEMTEEKRNRLAEKFGSEFADREYEARAQAIKSHEDVGSTLGRFAKSMAPDPQSTGAAAQIIHGVTKTVGKAVGYSVTGGLPAVAIGMSADEGINESLRLQDAGVDQATANKAGLVRAGTTAASVALPGVGPTLAKTAGLVVTAGPAAFMADQAAIRSILENADYKDKAAEYDPFDVTNLILSMAPGAVIGGIHLRGRAKAKASAGEAAIRDASEVGAKEEVNVANDASGITAAAEKEAAARVMQTDFELQAKALTPADDLVGQMNHQKAIDLAARQFDEGAPLDVRGTITDSSAVARIDETLYRGVMKEGQVDENGVLYTSTDRSYAESYAGPEGRLLEYNLNKSDELDLSTIQSIAKSEDVFELLSKRIGDDAAEKILYRVPVDSAGRLETYQIMRQPATAKILRDAGVDVVRFNQNDVKDSSRPVVAVLNAERVRDLSQVDESRNLQGNRVDESKNLQQRAELDNAHLDQPIVIAKAEDGTPITTTGREMLEDVRQQEIQANNDSKAYMAAIECFISNGDAV